MKLISSLNKIAAWSLSAFFLLYILSGFDVQQRLLTPQLSAMVHLNYLFIPALLAFGFHTTHAVYQAFKKKKRWNRLGKAVTALYALLNLALIFAFVIFRIND